NPPGSRPGATKARREWGMTARTGAGSVVPWAMARILLGVGVPAITLFYPQAWLFEPFFSLRSSAGTAIWTALPPSLAGCQARSGGMLGPGWQKLFALNRPAPAHSAIRPATLS